MSRGVYVWATRSDLLLMLERIERKTPLHYRPFDAFDSEDIPLWKSARDIENLEIASSGYYVTGKKYLVLPAAARFKLRRGKLNNGQTRYYVDQLKNPDSVVLCSGGQWSNDFLIMGEFSTVSPARPGFDLYRTVHRAVSAEFRKVKIAYLGPEACALAEQGVRLVDRADGPPMREVKLP
jgi:hypothetical protein